MVDRVYAGSRSVVIIVVLVLSLQRTGVTGRVLRHHVGCDEDVLGADERGIDEDVLDRAWSGRGSYTYIHTYTQEVNKSSAVASSDSIRFIKRIKKCPLIRRNTGTDLT